MGQVPQITFNNGEAEISCYNRKIRISKSKQETEAPIIQLLRHDDELDMWIHTGYWLFKNDSDFDIFWEAILAEGTKL
jgi:hypothetical protein